MNKTVYVAILEDRWESYVSVFSSMEKAKECWEHLKATNDFQDIDIIDDTPDNFYVEFNSIEFTTFEIVAKVVDGG